MLLCGLKFLFSPQSCLFLLEHQNFVVYHARDRSWCLRMALNVEFGVAIVQKRNINIVGASGFSSSPTQTYATCAGQVVRAGLPLMPSLRSDRAETPGRVIFHTCRHCSGCRMEGGSGDFYTIWGNGLGGGGRCLCLLQAPAQACAVQAGHCCVSAAAAAGSQPFCLLYRCLKSPSPCLRKINSTRRARKPVKMCKASKFFSSCTARLPAR